MVRDMTIQAAILGIRDRLRTGGIENPDLDARLLVQHVLELSNEEIIIKSNEIINFSQQKDLDSVTQRRLAGEPVSRILGTRHFWKYNFKLSKETLDPRADSETIIEAAIRCVHPEPKRILDLGTGTGCLLLSLLGEWSQATGVGVDISADAISTAIENAKALGFSARAEFMAGDWEKTPLTSKFNVIMSNPPYISEIEIENLKPEVRVYDPHRALSGGGDGLDAYRSLSRLLPKILAPEGYVFLEIGSTQSQAVKEMLEGGGLRVLETVPDLAGNDRCLVARFF